MTRLDRIIQAFNDYDAIIEYVLFTHDDISKEQELKELRNRVSILIGELKRHGCRRKW